MKTLHQVIGLWVIGSRIQIKLNLSYHSSIGSFLSQLIVSGSGMRRPSKSWDTLNLEHSVTMWAAV